MLVERIITKENRTLNLASSESAGPPLLLLHGVIRRWQDWVPLVPALSCRWQIHALDFHGHGRSGQIGDHYLLRDYLQDALTVIHEIATEPVVLFGHSLGALVALGAAAFLPRKVRAIVLEDPPSARTLANLKQTPYHAQFVAMRELAGATMSVGELTRRLVEIPIPTRKARFASVICATPHRCGSPPAACSCLIRACSPPLSKAVCSKTSAWMSGRARQRARCCCCAAMTRSAACCRKATPRRGFAKPTISRKSTCRTSAI